MGDLDRITPVAPRPRLEAILARSGLLVDKGAAWLAKRPPGSRTRRRMLSLLLVRGFMAHERKDVELTLLAYEPDVAIDLSGAEGLGLQPRYTGHEGWYELIGDLYENFRDPRYAVTRLVDAGDRVVFEFQFSGTGRVGGVDATLRVGTVMHLNHRGKVARQELFWRDGWDLALAAAGLSASQHFA